MKVLITLLLSFLMISSARSEIVETSFDYRIYYPEYPEILEDISPFTLGCISNYQLLFEYGAWLSTQAAKAGADACVIGYTQLFPEDLRSSEYRFEEDIAPFYSNASFRSAQVIMRIAQGLISGGKFPVLSAKHGIDDRLMEALRRREQYPGILLEDKEVDQTLLRHLELPVVSKEPGPSDEPGNDGYPMHQDMFMRMKWRYEANAFNEGDIRYRILNNAIVRLKKTRDFEEYELFYKRPKAVVTDKAAVFVKDPQNIDRDDFSTGYLIHSTDDFVIERIRLIVLGIYPARGTSNW